MKNFSTARAAMVEGQIRPMGVIDPHILAAFGSVPRERFVPDTQQSVAYRDEDVPLGEGRFLMEPAVHARMLEAVSPVKSCRILDVGGGTGYAAAILSRLVKSVTALESSKIFLDRAVRNWESEGLTNITGVQGGLKEGYPSGAPFDLVIVNGAVPELSVGLINQLVPGGRLIVILKKPGEAMGQATLVERHGGDFSSRALFEAGCPYVPGFEPAPAFVF